MNNPFGFVAQFIGLRSVRRFVSRADEKISYSGYRFPPKIIHRAIWLYLRFPLSLRDVEDLLSERGIAIPIPGGSGVLTTFLKRQCPEFRQDGPFLSGIRRLDLDDRRVVGRRAAR